MWYYLRRKRNMQGGKPVQFRQFRPIGQIFPESSAVTTPSPKKSRPIPVESLNSRWNSAGECASSYKWKRGRISTPRCRTGGSGATSSLYSPSRDSVELSFPPDILQELSISLDLPLLVAEWHHCYGMTSRCHENLNAWSSCWAVVSVIYILRGSCS